MLFPQLITCDVLTVYFTFSVVSRRLALKLIAEWKAAFTILFLPNWT